MTTATKTIRSITVRKQIDPAGIGDATGCNRDWQEHVCTAIDAEFTDYLSARFPDADLDIEVTVGRPGFGSLTVETDADDCGATDDALRDDLRDVAQIAFDKAC